jgi:LysM repeat protein/ABC-type branched-subunit amino acid transport system substrate-binding protein
MNILMKITHYLFVLLLVAGFTERAGAQLLKENEIVVIQGEKFVLHQVRTGETVYSISRQFQVDSQTLTKHNPGISDGLKIGDILKIPFREGVNWQQQESPQKGDPVYFESYTISSRTETPYFIAREFGITVEEIYAYNPEVTRFRKGTELRIPRWEVPESIPRTELKEIAEPGEEGETVLLLHEVQPGETLRSIARRYQISESEILFFNPGARRLQPGSILHIPGSRDDMVRDDSPEIHERPEAVSVARGSFFEHTIVSGETMWSLTRRYNVSEQELKKLNPLLEQGFPAGATIRIPVNESDLSSPEPVHADAFRRHVVQGGETLIGLASKYNITIPDIRKFNPQLESRNLVQGETVLIPRKIQEETAYAREIIPDDDSLRQQVPEFQSRFYDIELPVIIPEHCKPNGNWFDAPAVYEVALFLPLFIHVNDTMNRRAIRDILPVDSLLNLEHIAEVDTLVEIDEPEEMYYNFFRESENYLQFYEGVLLAVDSLQRAGMRIILNVFDSQLSADSIRRFIHSPQFLRTDLIIGPVFSHVQSEVAAIAAKNRIPIISPLSSQSRDLNNNPFYYQVNPTREFLVSKTADLIAEEYFNSNFVVVKTNHSGNAPEEKVIDLVREKLIPSGYWNQPRGLQYNLYDFSREGPFGLSRVLSRDKENVIFVSSMHEGDLSVVLSNINNLAGKYSITLIGFNRYEQFHSIQEEFYHNLRLQYVTPYWADYTHPETVRFLTKFRQHFHTDPGNFGMQGYDVAFYFLSALKNYGKEFEECLPYQQVHLSQGNYRFEKQSRSGGYMNQGVSVISYERNFDVVRKRVIGPYRFAQK